MWILFQSIGYYFLWGQSLFIITLSSNSHFFIMLSFLISVCFSFRDTMPFVCPEDAKNLPKNDIRTFWLISYRNTLSLWGFYMLFHFLCSVVVSLTHMERFLLTLFKWSKALSSKLPASLPEHALGLFQYHFQVKDDCKLAVLHSKPSTWFLAEVGPVKRYSFHFLDSWQLKLIKTKT